MSAPLWSAARAVVGVALLVLLCVGSCAGCVVCLDEAHAYADDSAAADARPTPPARVRRSHLWLARMCVGEAGWRSERDCAAMVAVIQRRATSRGVRLVTHARAYSRAIHPRRHRRPWLLRLAPTRSAPEGWPGGSWLARRADLERLLTVVAGTLEGTIADPCEGRAWHFGSPHLDGVPRGHERIDCGETVQAYYAPSGGGQ